MKRRSGEQNEMIELRRRAERRLDRTSSKATLPSEIDALKQLHELQVHQIELEMQNQELLRIRDEVEEGLARYTTLYDFAPIGYFTIDRNSSIAKLNLTGANLLQHTRSELTGRRFAEFVPVADRELFAAFLERVFNSSTVETLELELKLANRQSLFAHVEAIADGSETTCRAVIVDITARQQAEQRADELLRQNRSLTRRMFNVQESERRVLARELHDELGQWLTAIQAEAEAIRSNAGVNRDNRLLLSAAAISDSAGEIHRLIRQMLGRLRPSLLDSLGLAESMQALTTQWKQHHPQIACDLEIKGDLHGVSESLGITAYRLVQEALTNVAKHSQAKRVTVKLSCSDIDIGQQSCLRLTIADDGKGMDVQQVQSGLGLMGMRERVIAAGGEFNLSSEPRRGVQINVRLPFHTPPMEHQQ